VLDIAEAMRDAQFSAREMVGRRSDGTREIAPPFRMSGHAFARDRSAPALGAHTREVLLEAGLGEEAIARLAARNVVRAG